MDIIMNLAPSARTPLSLRRADIFSQLFGIFLILVPALFKETWQQPWLNIQQHIENLVSLYIGKDCPEGPKSKSYLCFCYQCF